MSPGRRRVLLRLLASFVGLLVLIPILCLDGVDYRPYLHERYFTEANTRLQSLASTNVLTRGVLSAGFGRARLTPQLNVTNGAPLRGEFESLPLAGYGNRHGKPAQGVHDDLFVKAVAIRVGDQLGVMVGADALIIPPEVTDIVMPRIESELKLARQQIYLSATHSHSSLGGWGKGMVEEAFAGGYRAGARAWFAECIFTAIREAIADIKPASMVQGQFSDSEHVRNRLVGRLGKIDPEFSFMVFKQEGGKLAAVGSYAAHATVLSGDQMEFSADYPGCWERAVEQATGGLAVFLAGSVGSHSPLPPEKGFAGADRMGQELAQTLLRRLPELSPTNSILFGTFGLNFSLPPTNVRLTDGLRLRPWVARCVMPVRQTSFLQGFRIENQIWLSTPCDFSGELALGIAQDVQRQRLDTVITSFNGDYIGYVIPLKYYHLDGYEPRTMSFFGPNVPDMFSDLLLGISHALAK